MNQGRVDKGNIFDKLCPALLIMVVLFVSTVMNGVLFRSGVFSCNCTSELGCNELVPPMTSWFSVGN